jgi:hypothetical protein
MSSSPDGADHGRVTFTPLPADARLTAADRCRFSSASVPGEGEWMMKIVEHVDTGLDALAAVLRQPSKPVYVDQACTMELIPPWVFTVTLQDGRTITPDQPQRSRGGPLAVVDDALAAMAWHVGSTSEAYLVSSQLEINTGCPGAVANALARQGALGPQPGADRADPLPQSPPVRVDRYAFDPDAPVGYGAPGDPLQYTGKLTSSTLLEGEVAQRLIDAINAAPLAAHPCSDPAVPFATVAGVYVELGGCNQMLDRDDHVRQLDATIVAIVTG